MECTTLTNLSMVRSHAGLLAEACRLAEESAAIARATGARLPAHTANNLVALALLCGDASGLRTLRARFAADEMETTEGAVTLPHLWAGQIAEQEGDRPAAVQAYERAVSAARTGGSRSELAAVLGFLARALLPEDVARARLLLEEARSIADEIGIQSVAVTALAWLAGIPGGDLAAAESAFEAVKGQLGANARMEIAFQLWRLTHRPAYLEEAHSILIYLRDHSPPEHQESILTAVPLHREIRSAWLQGTT
jgi:hypothetical protein